MTRAPDLRRAATMAYRVLAEQQVTNLPVDPLRLLRCCKNTVVNTYEETAEALEMTITEFEHRFGAADAFTLRRVQEAAVQYVVAYRADGNPARRRFTLAHELGHRVLGHTGVDRAEEREADCFASHLLCPRPVVCRLAERFEPLCAEQVAAACYVSLSCARQVHASLPSGVDVQILEQVGRQFAHAVEIVRPVGAHNGRYMLPKTPE